MGFAEDMQNSYRYTRGLKQKKYFYNDKAFTPKWKMDDAFQMKEVDQHKLLNNKNRNRAYLEEMKAKSQKGLIVGGTVVAGVFYYLVQYFL